MTKRRQGIRTLVVLKGEPGYGPDSQKFSGFMTVARAVLRVMGGTIEDGQHLVIIRVPDIPGDGLSVRKEVFAYFDLFRMRTPAEEDTTAHAMADMVRSKGLEGSVGWSCMIGYLEETYMRFHLSDEVSRWPTGYPSPGPSSVPCR